jgi:hypothetical protein
LEPSNRIIASGTAEPPAAWTFWRRLWSRVPVAIKRGVGLSFDCLCVLLLAVIPVFVHYFTDARQFNPDVLLPDAAQHYTGSFLLFASLCTPLPLISLRFFCRIVMRSRTPGELLCGYYPVSKNAGPLTLVQHLSYGFLQYVMALAAVSLSTVLAALSAATLASSLAGLITFGYVELGAVFLFVYCPCAILVLSAFFEHPPHSGYESGFDELCGLKVVEDSWFHLDSADEPVAKLAGCGEESDSFGNDK